MNEVNNGNIHIIDIGCDSMLWAYLWVYLNADSISKYIQGILAQTLVKVF